MPLPLTDPETLFEELLRAVKVVNMGVGASSDSGSVTGGDPSVTPFPRTSDGWDVFDGFSEFSSIETPTPLGGSTEVQGVGRCL